MKILYILPILFSLQINAQVNPDLKTAYTFEGNPNDLIGENHLSIYGDVSLTTDRFGNENCAYEFPGIIPTGGNYSIGDTSSYLYLDNPDEDLNVNFSEGWSLSLWYKGGSTSSGDLEHIFTRSDNPLNQFDVTCYEINLYDLNTPLISVFKDFPPSEPNNYIWADQTDANLDSSQWHHVVMVVDQNLSISLYVDNLFQDSISNPSLFDACDSKLFIGYDFEGKVDDIFFFHSPLSSDQVDSLYTLEGSCSNFVSIEENKLTTERLNLYPNPARDHVFINDADFDDNSIIEIYSLSGQLMHRSKSNSKTSKINIQGFASGFYTLQISSTKNSNIDRIKFVIE